MMISTDPPWVAYALGGAIAVFFLYVLLFYEDAGLRNHRRRMKELAERPPEDTQ